MTPISIAHLGPPGTYAEAAALHYANWLTQTTGDVPELFPYPSIGQTLQAVVQGKTEVAVVPMENSIEGSVTMTMDNLWVLDQLRIQWALILPIAHSLLSYATSLEEIKLVYSHPQAIAQCQIWCDRHLPQARLVATNSTTEALPHLQDDQTVGAIASQRAAQLYELPILVSPINDYPDNCTRFWVLSLSPSPGGQFTSLAFSLAANRPGALVDPLQVFAQRGINLSRIESRPSKRSLGDYLFFIDLEADAREPLVQSALEELQEHTETLKIFGSYQVLPM